MIRNMAAKALPLALTTLVCVTGVARAAENGNSDSARLRNLDNRVSALEQRKGAGGMINPQGRPQVRDGVDLFIYGDLLYWNAHENGLNIAVKQGRENDLLDDAAVNHLQGKWNWGFRAGLGYNTMHDGWDLRLTWLRFTDTGSNTPKVGSLGAFYPTMAMPGEGADNLATSVSGYWGFNLNQLDLDLGREFFVSKWLTLRPHVGLRTDWIHQNVKVDYFGVHDGARPDLAAINKDRWWGMGLEGGLDTQWGLGGGWSIFGNASAAILYGLHQMNVQNVNGDFTAADQNLQDYANVKDVYHVSHPILDFQLGLRWDVMFCNDRFHLGFDLGWEHHVYLSQNQFPIFVDDFAPGVFAANQGDLTLQGWTFAARFDF